jgi:DNA repair exonuclease SbcCD ATPase subunit
MVGLSIEISIDLTKASKPLNTKVLQADGLVFDHKELSGGEQQLVDICIAFGTHEMVSKSLPLLILDEVFENLDPNNISKVFDFVRMKVDEGKDIFIITHQENLDFTYTKIIDVVKKGYLTSIE